MNLAPTDLLPLIHDFLQSCGYAKLAQRLQSRTNFEDVQTGLRKKKLFKIVKSYIKAHP